MDSIHVKTSCEWDYITTKGNGPSNTTALCTVVMVLFTLVLEAAVHSYMNCCSTIEDEEIYTATRKSQDEEELLPVVTEQPQPEAAPQAHTPQNDTSEAEETEPTPEAAHNKPPSPPDCFTCCIHNPSPNIRANRLIAAIFLYAVILTAFIIRMHNSLDTSIRDECQRYISKSSIPGPNWWAVFFLNILPLIVASLSVLRAVVDCFLVRTGSGLKYVGEDGGDDIRVWPMCMAFFLVFVCIREVVRLPITLLMGMPRGSAGSRHRRMQMEEDIEIGGEEMRGLADHVDDGSDDEGDRGGPPAYDDAVHGQGGVQIGQGKAR